MLLSLIMLFFHFVHFNPCFMFPIKVNFQSDQSHWYVKKYDGNGFNNGPFEWVNEVKKNIVTKLGQNSLINDKDNISIPLNYMHSNQLQDLWYKTFGNESNSDFASQNVTFEFSGQTGAISILYSAVIFKEGGYLNPIYWKYETDIFFLLPSKEAYLVDKPPPVEYFMEISSDINMDFLQPIPAWINANESSILSIKSKPAGSISLEFNETKNMINVIFVTHGIGHHENDIGVVENAANIQVKFQNFNKKFHPEHDPTVFIPISWRHDLILDNDLIDASRVANIPFSEIFDPFNDVFYYKSENVRRKIQNNLIKKMNKKYEKFQEQNLQVKIKTSILAHSLGTCVSFDVLNDRANELKFEVRNLFMIGSPLGYMLLTKNITSESLKTNPWIKNGRIFNIFNSYDPIAYRLEPILNPDYQYVKPVKISLEKKFKKNYGNELKINENEENIVDAFYQDLTRMEKLTTNHSSLLKHLYSHINNGTYGGSFVTNYLIKLIWKIFRRSGNLKEKKDIPLDKQIKHRIDFDIAPFNSMDVSNQYYENIQTTLNVGSEIVNGHTSYWNSDELAAFMIKKIYDIPSTPAVKSIPPISNEASSLIEKISTYFDAIYEWVFDKQMWINFLKGLTSFLFSYITLYMKIRFEKEEERRFYMYLGAKSVLHKIFPGWLHFKFCDLITLVCTSLSYSIILIHFPNVFTFWENYFNISYFILHIIGYLVIFIFPLLLFLNNFNGVGLHKFNVRITILTFLLAALIFIGECGVIFLVNFFTRSCKIFEGDYCVEYIMNIK